MGFWCSFVLCAALSFGSLAHSHNLFSEPVLLSDHEGNHERVTTDIQPKQLTAAIQVLSPIVDVMPVLRKELPHVYKEIEKTGVKATGHPYLRYLEFIDEETAVVEIGVPVDRVLPTTGLVNPSYLPGGMIASALHIGTYGDLVDAYLAIEEWLEISAYPANRTPWEVFMSDPLKPSEKMKIKVVFQVDGL